MTPPEMVDEAMGIRLRFPRLSDVSSTYDAIRESIPDMAPWMSWCHEHYHRDEVEIWIRQLPDSWKSRESFVFLIEQNRDQKVLGSCSLSHLNWQHYMANLGYWIRSSMTGRGYATAAIRLLAQWGFTTLELNRIEILMGVENIRSRRVAEKVLASYEGVLRRRLHVGDRVLDARCYSLIPDDLSP